MNIMFMKQFPDGSPTYFREKILLTPFDGNLTKKQTINLLVSSAGVKAPYPPKIHTMRSSFRVKKGMRLDLCNWIDKPYRSKIDKFVKDIYCISTQTVEIKYGIIGGVKSLDVYIDGRILSGEQISSLVINDGFSSVMDFAKHFNKSAVYNLIHWTNLRYE